MELITVLIAVVLLMISIYWAVKTPKHLPPSPGIALPIVGHLYLMEQDPRQQFKKWSQKLGDVFSLRLGQETVIVLNSFDSIKEAFVKQGDNFSDRPKMSLLSTYVPHITKGLTLSSGAEWKEQRTVTYAILKKFGMGKNILADKITEEVNAFINELAKGKGKVLKSLQIRGLINVSVSNIICSIIFGKRFAFDDPKINHLTAKINELVLNSGVSKFNFLPFLRYLPSFKVNTSKFIANSFELHDFAVSMVNEIKSKHDANGLDNYILSYIHEMEKVNESNEPTNLSEVSLIRNIENLFLAGTETTSSTILWSLLFVLRYPETQKKIYQEIAEIVGSERTPSVSDRPQLKYLNAFIMETQRMGSLVPFAITHVCTEDTVLNGFNIPSGAQVIPNLDAVLKDEKIWGDPENFRPERFLDEEGNLMKREELIPFSIGRRICLGESLAKMELFLFLSSMFQKFEFLHVDPNHVATEKPVFAGIIAAPPFEIRCFSRIN